MSCPIVGEDDLVSRVQVGTSEASLEDGPCPFRSTGYPAWYHDVHDLNAPRRERLSSRVEIRSVLRCAIGPRRPRSTVGEESERVLALRSEFPSVNPFRRSAQPRREVWTPPFSLKLHL